MGHFPVLAHIGQATWLQVLIPSTTLQLARTMLRGILSLTRGSLMGQRLRGHLLTHQG